MTESRQTRLPVEPPSVPAPPRFVERRIASRRSEDRVAHQEARLLAAALDELAADRPAEARLAAILVLLARTVGARRAAVLAAGIERRVAVSVLGDDDEPAAEALAAWLDAAAPRSRSERAAGPAAAVSFASEAADQRPPTIHGAPTIHGGPTSLHDPGALVALPDPRPADYAWVALPGPGGVVLGFDFADARSAAALDERLPPGLARHAAAILAVATTQLSHERELAMLRARDTERARFVSTVAHELRTPLTGLNGYLDIVLEGRVDDPVVERDFIGRSRVIVESMSELVGDLLELSRLESGTLGLEIRPVSVEEIGSRVVHRLEPIAMERGIALTMDLPPRLRTATGDRRRIEQILTNVAGNALKFSAAGGLVELAGWFDGPVALIAVRDEGAGIAPDERGPIFDRFYRMTGHERTQGTGLGLPIARELARAMGGDLDVASVPGSGSSFILALPGPTTVDDDIVAVALLRSIATEEVRLEERAVLRAIRAAQSAPRAIPAQVRPSQPRRMEDGLEPAGGQSGALRSMSGRPVRLRSIDGNAGRPDAPAPA